MTRLGIVLTVLVLPLLASSTATAARSEFFGIVEGPALNNQDVQSMAAARVRTDRFMLNWGWVQPRSGGSFDWRGPDRLIGALASHGIRAVPAFWGNPPWVHGCSACAPLGTPRGARAWRAFLKAAVARYGPVGSFWANRYRRRYGASAKPVPIQSWQIWNEPNLHKYFGPFPSARSYGRLLKISHDAIKRRDPRSRILLAGMPGYGDVTAWDFLRRLYSVPRIKAYFDAAALHPYGHDLHQVAREIQRFRAVMSNHGDAATPLWLTELGWGSAPPDRMGINKGLAGQERMLAGAFKLILTHRKAWNVQRLLWYHWRDPRRPRAGTCSFCASSGLRKYNYAPKPAFETFKGFTADTTPPRASITSGPGEGSLTKDPSPSFSFASSEAGSTFECRFDSHGYSRCVSPLTRSSRLADGGHTFFVKAIDAPGNESAARSRAFTVDTTAPTVRISSGPANGSASADRSPMFRFASNEPDSRFRCRIDGQAFAPCSSPYATSRLADGRHSFQVKATDRAGNTGAAVKRSWRVGVPGPGPVVRISSGPQSGSTTNDPTPSFDFSSSDPAARFRCRLDGPGFAPCSSPYATRRLADGRHLFGVRAIDQAGNLGDPLEVGFRVDTQAPRVRIRGPRRVRTDRRRAAITFRVRAPKRVWLRCRIDSRHARPCSPRYRTPELRRGRHTLKVKAIDRAGNVGAKRKRFRIVGRAGGGTGR